MVDRRRVLTPEVLSAYRRRRREVDDLALGGGWRRVSSLTCRRTERDKFVQRPEPIAREADDVALPGILLCAYVGFVCFQRFPAVFEPPWLTCPPSAV